MDLFSGFWHVPVAQKDRGKTAVITDVGLYQFRCLPFGLRNAPSTFQRVMNTTFADMLYPRDEHPFLSAYVDDLLCHSTEWKLHLQHLEKVFIRCDKVGLSLKPSKCELCRHEQDVLGYKIDSKGRQPDPAKIKAVASFSRPKKTTDVQQFLGLAGYYRHHITFFAARSWHLRQLTKQNVWTTKEEHEFKDLKSTLCSDTVMLHHPNWNDKFIVQTDASSK